MGKKRRQMMNPKYAKKFAAKFAKFRAAVEEALSITAGAYGEIVEEKKVPKVIIKEVDESATAEPKPKKRSRKISPQKKSSDSKKKTTTRKRKSSKKD